MTKPKEVVRTANGFRPVERQGCEHEPDDLEPVRSRDGLTIYGMRCKCGKQFGASTCVRCGVMGLHATHKPEWFCRKCRNRAVLEVKR